MYGPRIGAIYHAVGVPCHPPIFLGGGQECNRRSGTENTPMAVGLGEAARLITLNNCSATHDLQEKRDLLVQLLKEKCPPNSIKVLQLFTKILKIPTYLQLFLKFPANIQKITFQTTC